MRLEFTYMQEYEPISEKNLQVPPLKQNSFALSGQLLPFPPIKCVSNCNSNLGSSHKINIFY